MRTLIVCGLSAVAIWGSIAAADYWHWVEVGTFTGRPLALEKGPDGVPQVLYNGSPYGLTYGRYVNGGWQKEAVGFSVAHNASFLVDPTNRPHIYWVSGTKLYHGEKKGATWVRAEVHDFSRQTGTWFDAAMKKGGNVYVTVDVANENGFRLLEVTPDDRIILNISHNPGWWANYVAASKDGRAHIVGNYTYLGECVGYTSWKEGQWTPAEQIDRNTEGGCDAIGLTCDSTGAPWVALNRGEHYVNYYWRIVRRVAGPPPRWIHVGRDWNESLDFDLDKNDKYHCSYYTFKVYGMGNKYDYKSHVKGGNGYWERTGKSAYVVLPQNDNKPAFVRTDGTSLEYWYYGTFTGVNDFAARSVAGGVALSWRPTTSYAGFNLYRGDGQGEPSKLNSSLITGRAPFRYVDADVSKGVTYSYELEAVKASGQSEYFGPLEVTFEGTPAKVPFSLGQSRPNPATAAVTIPFALASASAVEFAIYDVAGRRVFHQTGSYGAGPQELVVDVGALAPGVYVYRFKVEGRSASRKMVVGR